MRNIRHCTLPILSHKQRHLESQDQNKWRLISTGIKKWHSFLIAHRCDKFPYSKRPLQMSNFAMGTILKGFCTSLYSIITGHCKSQQRYKKLRQISVTWSSPITCRYFLRSSSSRDINEHTKSLFETRCPLISRIRVMSMPRNSGMPCVYFGNEVRSSSGSSIGVFSDRWQESFGNNAIIHCTHVPSPATRDVERNWLWRMSLRRQNSYDMRRAAHCIENA